MGVKVAPTLDVESNLGSPEARLLHSQRAGLRSDAKLGISFPNQSTRCPGHPLWAALVTSLKWRGASRVQIPASPECSHTGWCLFASD